MQKLTEEEIELRDSALSAIAEGKALAAKLRTKIKNKWINPERIQDATNFLSAEDTLISIEENIGLKNFVSPGEARAVGNIVNGFRNWAK